MRGNTKGFTLLEALVALLVTALLLAIAVPAWSNATSAVHAGKARLAMAETVLDAVRHSALTATEVVVCSSDDPGATRCSLSVEWTDGWIAFPDINGNRERDPNEPLLQRRHALEGGARLRSTPGRTRLVFQPHGGNAGSNVTFTLCDKRGVEKAVTLVLANDGRARSGTPTREAAQACVQAG
ncbi:MAG: GspH/FimT family protein [Proteobacteria bacterium]|nr:GspH/FimT family protein [Pseudomonadota bacterium]